MTSDRAGDVVTNVENVQKAHSYFEAGTAIVGNSKNHKYIAKTSGGTVNINSSQTYASVRCKCYYT